MRAEGKKLKGGFEVTSENQTQDLLHRRLRTK